MGTFIGILLSLFLVYASWPLVPMVFSRCGLTDPDAPEGVDEDLWEALRESGTEAAGAWLGGLERAVGVAAMWTNSMELVIGWLAFKVASKWQVWSTVVKVPDSIKGVGEPELLTARRKWGANLLMRFWIGTLGNLLVGIGCGYIGRLIFAN